ALLRWKHPSRGLLHPAEFIPLAEETGLIIPMGHWVVSEACRQMQAWQPILPVTSTFMSINVSSKQFLQLDLVEQITRILTETGLAPGSLRLEITESVILENTEPVKTVLQRLKTLGIRLSIDDFGTGYSSLSYLHRFPIDTLKIDRSFVDQMGADVESAAIVQTIITLAHHLRMEVIAEGLETTEQLTQLRALDCEYGQGYLFFNPADCESVQSFLKARPRMNRDPSGVNGKDKGDRRPQDESILVVSGYDMCRFPFSEVTKAKDVSAGGISFSLKKAVAVGADLELRIYSPTCEPGHASPAFRARVRIVQVSRADLEDVGLVGAEFQGQIINLSDVYNSDRAAAALLER